MNERSGTHELVKHDQQPDSCEFYSIALTGDDELTDALCLKSAPAGAIDAVRRGSTAECKGRVDDGDMSESCAGDVIEFATDVGVEGWFGRRSV